MKRLFSQRFSITGKPLPGYVRHYSLCEFGIRNLLIILASLILSTCYAQPDSLTTRKKQFPSVSAAYFYGKVLPTNDFVEGDNMMGKPLEHFESFAVKVLWQNPGYKDWQKVYHCPYYGAGLSVGNFYDPEEVGYPVSLYGILGIPVVRLKKLELYSEFQFGLAWNWQHYDSISNPKNIAVGGGLTVHLNIGFDLYYALSRNVDLGAGISFIHFSNGGFERPNRGFNVLAPSLELKYRLTGHPDISSVRPPGRLPRSNDLYFMIGYGDEQLNDHELDTNYFAVAGLSVIYFRQLSNAFRLGVGTDFNYWMGLTANPDGTMGPRGIDNLTVGFILQPEFIIDRLTLVGGIGIYAIHLDYNNFEKPYQRLGVRYEFYKNLSVGVNIRSTNFMLAEFLEFNLGYRIKWKS